MNGSPPGNMPGWIEHVLAPGVRAISTLRGGNADDYGWASGASARAGLVGALGHSVTPIWMEQVHGADCVDLDAIGLSTHPVADAAVTRIAGRAAAVLTADCLPLLLSSRDGSTVAAVHAGWRGLAAGVIAATVDRMGVDPATLVGAFGPAVGPDAYEVGPEVREIFLRQDSASAQAFRPGRADRWHANLYQLAQQQLTRLGVVPPSQPDWCTQSAPCFHSWRRDGQSAGRMAHLVWRVLPSRTTSPQD